MRAVAWICVAVGACSSAPRQQQRHAAPDVRTYRGLALKRPPTVDLSPRPSLSTWTDQPTTKLPPLLKPHVPLAQIYDVDDWRSLCDQRGLPRNVDPDAALAYLDVWCQSTSATDALAKLSGVVASTDHVIAAGARRDAVELLIASRLEPEAAVDWLDKHRLPAEIDRLANHYISDDRVDDAFRVLVNDKATTTISGPRLCDALMEKALRDLKQVHSIREKLLRFDAIEPCHRYNAELGCPLVTGDWRPCETGCGLALQTVLERCAPVRGASEMYSLAAAALWPREATYYEWITFGGTAASSAGVGEALSITAFENAVIVSDCKPEALQHIRETIGMYIQSPQPEHAARVTRLRNLSESACREIQNEAKRDAQ